MGEIINVRCKACREEWQCFTGNGLLHCKKENILAAFSEEKRQQAERMIAESKTPAYDFQYRPAVCGHCHSVVAVPVLRASDSEEICVDLCPMCGEEIKNFCPEELSVEEWSQKTACPVCECRKLETEDGGYWD